MHIFRKSASCTHVSALLHALSALHAPSAFEPSIQRVDSDDEEESLPCTSQPCRWKPPKKRKESTLRLSDAEFVKHDYAKPVKKKIKQVENFDPRPESFRGTAKQGLPELLQKLKGEQLGVSLLLDSQYQVEDVLDTPTSQNIPDVSKLKETILSFKETLQITAEKAREIERDTREQRNSNLWFSVRRHRITSSLFGAVLSRKPDTPPDSLVLRIVQPKSFSTPAITYGVEKEKCAIKEYISYQHSIGHKDLFVTPSGVIINPHFSFLGASPDGAVYDPSNLQEPFGFLEVKCPYTCSNVTPIEACSKSGFYCKAMDGKLKLKESHYYYAQVQGQMAVGERPWCDFVVFTLKGISVERIRYNQEYWKDKLLPKLTSFYDNCVAPELVSPVHVLGVPIRDLSNL